MRINRESRAVEDRQENDETLDRLAGDWWIFQLRRGHRYATDDVLTAWTALRASPRALRLLDLGAGTGALGLLTLLRLPVASRLTCVEVQEASAGLIRKTVEHNRLGDRVEILRGDLREPGTLPPGAGFDLVTANPPYLAPHAASHSPHPQRLAARVELRGDVHDFCRAASRSIGPDGRFCFCHSARDPRPEDAIVAAGLRLIARREVIFREGRPPTIALFTCGRNGRREDPEPLVIRDARGGRTEAYRDVRREMWIEE